MMMWLTDVRDSLGMEWGVMGLKNFTKPRSLWVWKNVFE